MKPKTREGKDWEKEWDSNPLARRNPKGFIRSLLKSKRQELKKEVEEKKVPQGDIDKVDEKYKLIYNSHNETIDMFLTLLEAGKEEK